MPKKITDEFYSRWSKVDKLNSAEFIDLIRRDSNRDWWEDLDSVFRSYDSYLGGEVNVRYPSGLETTPLNVLSELLNELAELIDG